MQRKMESRHIGYDLYCNGFFVFHFVCVCMRWLPVCLFPMKRVFFQFRRRKKKCISVLYIRKDRKQRKRMMATITNQMGECQAEDVFIECNIALFGMCIFIYIFCILSFDYGEMIKEALYRYTSTTTYNINIFFSCIFRYMFAVFCLFMSYLWHRRHPVMCSTRKKSRI